MSDAAQIVIAICSAISTVGVPIVGYLLARQNSKQTEKINEISAKADVVAERVEEVVIKAEEVKLATNGIKAELVQVTAQAARAEGKAEGISEERDRKEGGP